MRQQFSFAKALLITAGVCSGLWSLRPTAARADEWGCEVLLCMSNPAGPEAASQCVPPMERFYKALKHGGSRPTCLESGWGGDIGYEAHECPPGYVLTTKLGQDDCESPTGNVGVLFRTQPYFIEIPSPDGKPGTQRIWLTLQ